MLVQIVTENGQKKVIPLTADVGAGNPVGTIIPMYKKSNPSGYLYCDGSTFDETKYPLLYAYLGSNVLPDYREAAIVGAEQNTTNTIATHDVFTEGEFKDDSFKSHNHTFTGSKGTVSVSGGNHTHQMPHATDSGGSSGYMGGSKPNWIDVNTSSSGNLSMSGTFTPKGSISNTGSDVTRGKRKAVYFYIKATSGLSENAQDNVVAQLNEERSYSTDEINTGKKWIDGKPIYRKILSGILTSATGTMDIAHNIANIDKVVNVQGFTADTNGSCIPSGFYATTSYFFSISGDRTQYHIRTTTAYGGMTYTAILEYTKTTD